MLADISIVLIPPDPSGEPGEPDLPKGARGVHVALLGDSVVALAEAAPICAQNAQRRSSQEEELSASLFHACGVRPKVVCQLEAWQKPATEI